MRKYLIIATVLTACAALAVALYSPDRSPRPVGRACDVLTTELAESLVGPITWSRNDYLYEGLVSNCDVHGRESVSLYAQRYIPRAGKSALTRARWHVRHFPSGEGVPVDGLGDEAYLHVYTMAPNPVPQAWRLVSSTDLLVRVGDLYLRAQASGPDARTIVERLVRAYLARHR